MYFSFDFWLRKSMNPNFQFSMFIACVISVFGCWFIQACGCRWLRKGNTKTSENVVHVAVVSVEIVDAQRLRSWLSCDIACAACSLCKSKFDIIEIFTGWRLSLQPDSIATRVEQIVSSLSWIFETSENFIFHILEQLKTWLLKGCFKLTMSMQAI